jgi:citrate lyase subunit beta / citryl-CoA lyase
VTDDRQDGSCAPAPLRSLLFVPAHRHGWADKAVAAGADGILLDLQDAVPDQQKAAARALAATTVERLRGSGRAVLVRVAPPGTADLDADLDAVVWPGLHGVVVPLVRSPADVGHVAAKLSALEAARRMSVGATVVMPLVETAQAARWSYEVATASNRVAYMGAGTGPDGDIAGAIGFQWTATGHETLFLRSWVLLNVRAAGVPFPLSGIWPYLDDLDGLRRFAEQTRGLGYTGMMAIHPSHVAVINDVFTPKPRDVERWQATIAALDASGAAGIGATRLGDTMVDAAHGRTAREGLALAARLGVAEPRT